MNRDYSPCKTTPLEGQMLLKKSVRKAKFFLHKTLLNLKSFQCGGYGNLPKVPPFGHYISRGSQKSTNLDQSSYRDFSQQWDSDGFKEETKSDNASVLSKDWANEEYHFNGNSMKLEKKIDAKIKDHDHKKEKKTGSFSEGGVGNLSSRESKEGGYVLAQRMKELEMMDMKDLDHVLDIEEVLYYYSHLKSPVYRDIVDQFFVDMHSEFILPKPSANVGNSSRRLSNSSQRLGNSSRRLAPLKL